MSKIQIALIDLYVAIKIRDEDEINNYDQNNLIIERNSYIDQKISCVSLV